MILVSDKTQQKTYYFPKEKNSGDAATLKLFSHLSKSEFSFDVSGSTTLDLYYALSPDFSGVYDGEYDYSIYDANGIVLQNGLLRIGEYDAGDIIYDFKEEYVIYNPETGESEIIEYGDCTDAVNDAYRSGFQSGNTVGYNNGYESGLTQGFPIGYQSGRTDGWNAGYEAGEGDGFQNGYESGHSKGMEEGFEYGFGSGFTGGYESGFTDGYESGCSGTYEDAYNAGLQAGIESGKTIGFESGWTNGYSSGYTDGSSSGTGGWESGYTSGYTDGYSSGWTDGYESGSTSGTPIPVGEISITAPETIYYTPSPVPDIHFSIVSNMDGRLIIYRQNEMVNSGVTFHSGTTNGIIAAYGSSANTVVYRFEAYGVDSATTASAATMVIPYVPSSGYASMPFTIQMLEDGNITFRGNGSTLYQVNGGERQVLNGSISGLSAGDEVQFTVSADTINTFTNNGLRSNARHNAKGNIMSLLYVDFESVTTLPYERNFESLFLSDAGLINAENLVLPATTLSEGCYWEMFKGCTNLITAPVLPATTLASKCYREMFGYCTSLTTAPVLPATTLVYDCYYLMFVYCHNLNYIKCLATDNMAGYCTHSWVDGVSSTGTFIKSASMNDWTSGNDGIPNGWTVISE